MNANENIILEDFLILFDSFNKYSSFSKKRKIVYDINKLNRLYWFLEKKQVILPLIQSDYHKIFEAKSSNRNLYNYYYLIEDTKDYFLKCAHSYGKCLGELNFISQSNPSCKTKYTEKEIKELVMDFFSSMGNLEYSFVKRMFEENKIISKKDLETDEFLGICYGFENDINPYVVFKNDKCNLFQIKNLIHELGHAYEHYMHFDRFDKYYDSYTSAFIEVTSSFFELEFLKYLEENKINSFDTVALKNYFYNYTEEFLKAYIDCFEREEFIEDDKLYVREKDYYEIDEFRNLTAIFKEYDENVNFTNKYCLFNFPLYHSMIYGIGYYMSLHLSEVKKNDSRNFKKSFNNYLTTRTLMSYPDIIESMGISLRDFCSSEMLKTQIEENQKKYKRQLKIEL